MITIGMEPFEIVEQNQHLIKEHWNEVTENDHSEIGRAHV